MLCNNFIRICIFIGLFSISINLLGQKSNKAFQEIDSLIRVGDSQIDKLPFEQSYEFYAKTLEKSKNLGYSKGIAYSYLGMGRVLWSERRLDECTEALLAAKREKYAPSDPLLMSYIYFNLALNLHENLLLEEAIKYYRTSITYANKINNIQEKNTRLVSSYNNIADIFLLSHEYDSAFYYTQKSYNIEHVAKISKIVGALNFSEIYIEKNELDSAKKYLNWSQRQLEDTDYNVYKDALKSLFGKYYYARGEYEKAIEELKKLNDDSFKNLNYAYDHYNYIAKAYERLGKKDSANAYNAKYAEGHLNAEKLNRKKILKNRKVPILIANEEKKEIKKEQYGLLALILGGSAFIIGLMLFKFRKNRKSLSEKQKETRVLKQQLNSAFEEIIELAKTNSPNFLPRFIEVYPDFYETLMEIEPSLTSSELTLAAYLKLDFSTKEISDYNFVSIRTVQNRRYRLRKKLNLDANIDLNNWLQNLKSKSKSNFEE